MFPGLEQWIIESGGEPVGRLIFSIVPDQILVHDVAMLPGRCGVGGRIVIKDVIFAEAIRTGKIMRASVTPYIHADQPQLDRLWNGVRPEDIAYLALEGFDSQGPEYHQNLHIPLFYRMS
jgi:hypothetical protein